jgi:hypothetical protein
MLKDDQVMKHNSVRQASIYLSEDDFTEVSMKALKNWLHPHRQQQRRSS